MTYIGSQTQLIPLHERTLLFHLQPQPRELFAQHGWCVVQHARHGLPGAVPLLQSFPGHLDNDLVSALSTIETRHAPDVVLALVPN